MSSDGSLSSWSRDGVKARFPRSRDGQQESGLRSGSRGRPAWMDRVPHRLCLDRSLLHLHSGYPIT